MTPTRIYLHWAATGYDWNEPGHYHTVIGGNGVVHRLTDYHEALHEHTYARNTNAVALAVACMAPIHGGTWDLPPTESQLEALCKETAKVALGLKFPLNIVKLQPLIMTHAEAAANRDYPLDLVQDAQGRGESYAQSIGLPHDNYGPSSWHDGWPGGSVERWDLWQLRSSDKGGTGGFELRKRILEWMKKIKGAEK